MMTSRIEEIARILAGAIARIEAKKGEEQENRANSMDSEQN